MFETLATTKWLGAFSAIYFNEVMDSLQGIRSCVPHMLRTKGGQ